MRSIPLGLVLEIDVKARIVGFGFLESYFNLWVPSANTTMSIV